MKICHRSGSKHPRRACASTTGSGAAPAPSGAHGEFAPGKPPQETAAIPSEPLLIPALEIFQVHAKAQRDHKIQATAPNRPSIAVIRVVPELPACEENKKKDRAGYEYFVCREKFHGRYA